MQDNASNIVESDEYKEYINYCDCRDKMSVVSGVVVVVRSLG